MHEKDGLLVPDNVCFFSEEAASKSILTDLDAVSSYCRPFRPVPLDHRKSTPPPGDVFDETERKENIAPSDVKCLVRGNGMDLFNGEKVNGEGQTLKDPQSRLRCRFSGLMRALRELRGPVSNIRSTAVYFQILERGIGFIVDVHGRHGAEIQQAWLSS